MQRARVGIDSYGLDPLGLSPLQILAWAKASGAEGVQFSGLPSKWGGRPDEACLREIREFVEANHLYLEWGGGRHIPLDLQSGRPVDIYENNLRAADQARRLGARVIRSCSGGLMRWNPNSPTTDSFLRAMAKALRSQRPMLRDHGVILAIETHFEFTTFELVRLFEMCGADPGDYLGICLDTMNLLTMLEDPLTAAERIRPWVVATHIKDGGILLDAEGLLSFPAAIGEGLVDIRGIVQRLAGLPHEVHLSVEDHGGSFRLPIFDPGFLERFPDLSLSEGARLLSLAARTRDRIEAGGMRIETRESWPSICEARIRRDIDALKRLAGG